VSPVGSIRAKTFGIVLIVLVGVLNIHVPHFLLEAATDTGVARSLLELLLLANVLGAAVAAGGISGNRRWGWLLGIGIVGLSVLLYFAQETVGLPGLPKMWLEPSRLLALLVEASFVVVARAQLVGSRQPTPA
jgi:hypothetical protein